MSIAVRSPLIAGVALLGAGAIAAAPMAPPAAGPLPLRSIAVQNTALAEQLPLSPFRAFAPVAEATFADTAAIVQRRIQDPFPLLRAVLSNQTKYLLGESNYFLRLALVEYNPMIGLLPALGAAALTLGDGSVNLPRALAEAAARAAAGDVPGAIELVQKATLGPSVRAAALVNESVQQILTNQLAVVRKLLTTVPQAGGLVLGATQNAVNKILEATTAATEKFLGAVGEGGPVGAWNAAVQGAAEVAMVTEQVTIGNGVPDWSEEEFELVQAKAAKPVTPLSIRRGVLQAQFLVREAILYPREAVFDQAELRAAAAVEGGGTARSVADEKAPAAKSPKKSGVAGSARAKHAAE